MEFFKYTTLILGILFSSFSFAGNGIEDGFLLDQNSAIVPDLKAGIMAKLIPIQAAAFAEGGLGLVIWGDEKSGHPMYGYVRLAARITSAGILNRGEVRLEVFPVSFAGIVANASVTHRGDKPLRFDNMDCKVVSCEGILSRMGIGTDISLAIGKVFILPNVKFERLHADTKLETFADEESNLRAKSKTDDLLTTSLVVGYQLSEKHSMGAYFTRQMMMGTNDTNNETALFFRYKDGQMIYAAMAGFYGDSLFYEGNLTFGFSITYTPYKSVGL